MLLSCHLQSLMYMQHRVYVLCNGRLSVCSIHSSQLSIHICCRCQSAAAALPQTCFSTSAVVSFHWLFVNYFWITVWLVILWEKPWVMSVVRNITSTRVMTSWTWIFRHVLKAACSTIPSQSCCGWSFSHSSTHCVLCWWDQSLSLAWRSSTLLFR